ncbi:hypothetical protein B0J13DRAFT_603393 [Dactylonectria estremocensis]|uniref:Uncharacterized protein n=1 Tax=Dactylonectria estremocensis TaxID=1079267 RepID=A0A9P9JEX4_9HYPO|nr:hypothetical protein B0J13DRAFT_603393 [Dactylonectria estremocensis]
MHPCDPYSVFYPGIYPGIYPGLLSKGPTGTTLGLDGTQSVRSAKVVRTPSVPVPEAVRMTAVMERPIMGCRGLMEYIVLPGIDFPECTDFDAVISLFRPPFQPAMLGSLAPMLGSLAAWTLFSHQGLDPCPSIRHCRIGTRDGSRRSMHPGHGIGLMTLFIDDSRDDSVDNTFNHGGDESSHSRHAEPVFPVIVSSTSRLLSPAVHPARCSLSHCHTLFNVFHPASQSQQGRAHVGHFSSVLILLVPSPCSSSQCTIFTCHLLLAILP